MTEREKIAARVRALRAKTVENGCTEDEAIAAAEKLAELLERYNMTVDEVEMRASPFGQHQELHGDDVGERLWKIAAAISHLTGAQYWVSRPGVHPVAINFFGFEHEVEVARYLLEICARAMRQQYLALEQANALFVPAARRRRILPYLDGMADRLSLRIRALKPAQPPGTGLIVLHDALVKAAMRDAGLDLEQRLTRNSRDHDPAYGEGWIAGGEVALNRGISSGQRVAGLIG